MQPSLFPKKSNHSAEDFLKNSIEQIKKDIALMKSDFYSLFCPMMYLVPECGKEKFTLHFIIRYQSLCVQSLERILKGESITQADADALLKIEPFSRYKSLITSNIEKMDLEKKAKVLTQDEQKPLTLAIEGIKKAVKLIEQSCHYLAPENTITYAIFSQDQRIEILAKILKNEKITKDDADLLLKMKEFQPYESLITSKIEKMNLEVSVGRLV